jgi:hypothetical protein
MASQKKSKKPAAKFSVKDLKPSKSVKGGGMIFASAKGAPKTLENGYA